jgi:outer membrane protein TolC
VKRIAPYYFSLIFVLLLGATAGAQQAESAPAAGNAAPVTITLQDALRMAQANSPQFRAAVTDAGMAREDKVQARAGMLPGLSYQAQYLYTEGNGTPSGRFIANNSVHEYVSQGNAHEEMGLGPVAQYRRTAALEAAARARLEIAERGLVVTVTSSYYNLVVAQREYANAQLALTAAQDFLRISRDLEGGGEVAHSDVIKAELQRNERTQQLAEAQLAMQTARLDLAVLIFPNFTQDFTVVDDLRLPPPLPAFADAQKLAAAKNPDLKQAVENLQAARQGVLVAWAGHLPSLSFDYWYGIDASHFATQTGGVHNLGYAAAATLNLPVFNWGATESKVKQAGLQRQQAQVELSYTQRQLVARLQSAYAEATVARAALDNLRNSAELAAESERLTTLRYRAGEASALEVVDAQNTLAQARNAYDQGELRYRVALATLQTLTGSF